MKQYKLLKFIFLLIIFLCKKDFSYSQIDSIFYKVHGYTLYSNGIFDVSNGIYSRGTWEMVNDSIVRLTSFPEYKNTIFCVHEYEDTSSSEYSMEVYDKSGALVTYRRAVEPNDFFMEGNGKRVLLENFFPAYYVKNYKANHFVWIVQMMSGGYARYYDNDLFRITDSGLVFIHPQRASRVYWDSSFSLYANGIFTMVCPHLDFLSCEEPLGATTSGIWNIEQDSLIHLKSFDDYKGILLNAQAFYDSTTSDFVIEVYDTHNELKNYRRGDADKVFELNCHEPTINLGPRCPLYTADTTKFNHFVFVVQTRWNDNDYYLDELFKKTPRGLQWIGHPDLLLTDPKESGKHYQNGRLVE